MLKILMRFQGCVPGAYNRGDCASPQSANALLLDYVLNDVQRVPEGTVPGLQPGFDQIDRVGDSCCKGSTEAPRQKISKEFILVIFASSQCAFDWRIGPKAGTCGCEHIWVTCFMRAASER